MRFLGTRTLRTLIVLGALALLTAGSAVALQKPGRTVVRAGQIRLVALNNASLAFMVSRTRVDCDHIELWDTNRKGIWRFGKRGRCTEPRQHRQRDLGRRRERQPCPLDPVHRG